jgi:hypothetical protein
MWSCNLSERCVPSKMAGPTGLEPATSGVTGLRSNQLSYDPAMSTAWASEWWEVQDSNLRHPACKADALPAELTSPKRETSEKERERATLRSRSTEAVEDNRAARWRQGDGASTLQAGQGGITRRRARPAGLRRLRSAFPPRNRAGRASGPRGPRSPPSSFPTARRCAWWSRLDSSRP